MKKSLQQIAAPEEKKKYVLKTEQVSDCIKKNYHEEIKKYSKDCLVLFKVLESELT